MKHKDKQKRVQEIAAELDELGYRDVAKMLRDAVTSEQKKSNEQSETNEGDNTGGSNPPPSKEKPDKP